MPGQLDAPIDQGGTNVSGGQRQRLSIARALVKRPRLYLFDDCFSALDAATDARLRMALKTGTRGATVVIVAQRVSTIMHADQIIVLDEGRVAGMGTHRELMAGCAPTGRSSCPSSARRWRHDGAAGGGMIRAAGMRGQAWGSRPSGARTCAERCGGCSPGCAPSGSGW